MTSLHRQSAQSLRFVLYFLQYPPPLPPPNSLEFESLDEEIDVNICNSVSDDKCKVDRDTTAVQRVT